MKKRMLITTIVMMLVLAVALTTSSLAWFSASQATVTASGGSFTAETAGSAANIGVAKSFDATNWKASATMNENNTKLVPLCAIAELPQQLGTETPATGAFTTLGALTTGEGNEKFNGATFLTPGDASTQYFPLNSGNEAYKKTLAELANQVIYAKNLDNNNTTITSLTVKLTINSLTDGAADPNFYIVLTEGRAALAEEVVLRTAVMSKTDGYVAFDFSTATSTDADPLLLSEVDAAGNKKTGSATIANAANANQSVTFSGLSWEPGDVYAVHVYVWYEGGTLDVDSDGCTHTYSLDLTAGVATTGE